MWEEVLDLAFSNGLWAVLFVLLFLYQIKSSTNREQKYLIVIEKLSNSFGLIKNVEQNVKGIARDFGQFKKYFATKEGAF